VRANGAQQFVLGLDLFCDENCIEPVPDIHQAQVFKQILVKDDIKGVQTGTGRDVSNPPGMCSACVIKNRKRHVLLR
jgi:hypothetical protein